MSIVYGLCKKLVKEQLRLGISKEELKKFVCQYIDEL